jgi:hypothetical protein
MPIGNNLAALLGAFTAAGITMIIENGTPLGITRQIRDSRDEPTSTAS